RSKRDWSSDVCSSDLRDNFIGQSKPGRIISILGDTRNTELNKEFVKNADILIHEATFNDYQRDLARKYFHTTTKQAASLARDGRSEERRVGKECRSRC